MPIEIGLIPIEEVPMLIGPVVRKALVPILRVPVVWLSAIDIVVVETFAPNVRGVVALVES